MLRGKNFFDLMTNPDPVHFRRIMFNFKIFVQGMTPMCVEIQLHHKDIREAQIQSNSHVYYTYFRALLKDMYETELNKLLDTALYFFKELKEIPVLLSMLILIITQPNASTTECLPVNRNELYCSALKMVLMHYCENTDCTFENVYCLFRFISVANMLAQRRIFTSTDVEEATLSDPELLITWNIMRANKSVRMPLIKVLSEGGTDSEFMFAHTSFQEAMLGQALDKGEVKDFFGNSTIDVSKLFDDPFLRNTFVIGAGAIGKILANVHTKLDFFDAPLSADGWICAKGCVVSHSVTGLSISGDEVERSSLKDNLSEVSRFTSCQKN